MAAGITCSEAGEESLLYCKAHQHCPTPNTSVGSLVIQSV